MPIQFKCEFCGKSLKTDDSKAGKRVKCPGCSEPITIPELELLEPIENEDLETDDDDSEEDDDDSPPRRRRKPKRSSTRRSSSNEYSVADPGRRLLAAIVDGIIINGVMIPGLIMMAIGSAEAEKRQSDSAGTMILFGVLLFFVGGIALFGLYIFMYATRSQSIGKWLLSMQVMDYETDEPAGIAKAFFLRGFLSAFIGCIPAIGPLYGLVDSLFIFGEEHRCLHDKIAGTYVVKIS